MLPASPTVKGLLTAEQIAQHCKILELAVFSMISISVGQQQALSTGAVFNVSNIFIFICLDLPQINGQSLHALVIECVFE